MPLNWDVTDIVKEHFEGWRVVWRRLAIECDSAIIPSRKAAPHWDVDFMNDRRCRNEWSISTAGLLSLALHNAMGAVKLKVHSGNCDLY